ncbi:MAG: hypothetical protein K2P35_10230 [Lachnospiraceae bacterium]|nr:hypothetical protein [Lachnospiraceae bacterium]
MEMDINMTKIVTAFAILGIEATKDENLIRSAYRMALPANNPEENPEGFKSLREAYENALAYSRTPDEDLQQVTAEMIDTSTPMGAFRAKLADIYKSISARISLSSWIALLKNEVFEGLDSFDEAKWALFIYLAENYRITHETYILLDEYFHIRENEQEFKEHLPVGFVDFMISNISNPNGGYSYEWMSMLKGADDADYDTFFNYIYELGGELNNEESTRAGDLIKAIDALEIWHPHYAIDKAEYLRRTGNVDAALEIVTGLLEQEDYHDDLHVQMVCGSLLWNMGKKEEAYKALCRSLEINSENYAGNKYAAFYEIEHGETREALNHIYAIRNLSDDEELNEAANKVEKEFIALCERNMKEGTIEPEDVRRLVYAYGYQDQPDKAIAAIQSDPSYEKEIKGYHMLLSYMYKQKKDYVKAAEHGEKRLAVIQGKLADLEAGRPIPEDDTKESLERSLSDAYLQLGLMLMIRAKDAITIEGRFDLYKQAIPKFLDACAASSDNVTAQLNLAYSYSETRQYQKAYEVYDQLIKDLGVQSGLLFLKQRVCYEMDNAQEVIDLFYQMLNAGAQEAGIYEYTVRVFLDYRQLDDAKDIFARAQAAEVTSFGLRALQLVYDYYAKPDSADIAVLNKAIDDMLIEGERDAEDVYIRDYLAELYYMKGMCAAQFQQNKVPHLKSAIEVNDRAKYHMALATCYAEQERADEALQEYQYVEQFFAPDTELYIKMAERYHDMNDIDTACKYIQKAIDLAPDRPGIYKVAARAYDDMAVGRRSLYHDSIAFWKRYISSEPEDMDFALYRCGCALMQLGRYEEAIAEFEKGYGIADENAKYDIGVSLGKAYGGLGQFAKGAEYIEEALQTLKEKERGERYAYTATLALSRTYMKLGRFADAEKLLRGSLRYYDAERKSHMVRELKNIYVSVGEYDKALHILKSYSELFDDAYSVYLQLYVRHRACTTVKEKKSVLKEVKKALHKYNTYDLRDLYADILAYDFLMIKEAIPVEEKLISYTSSDHKEIDWEDSNGCVLELIRFNKFLKREKEVERYKQLFVNALYQYVGCSGEEAFDRFIESDPTARLDNLTLIVDFLAITGEIRLAEKYAAMMNGCVMCSFCNYTACCDRLEAIGILYEAKGDMARAYEYFEKAVQERSYYKGHAMYRLMTKKK